ncbi:Protein LMBR1L, partial [Balearica regulorum gibbericeps]
GYPLAMLGLLALTGISVLIVCFHVLELLLDDAAMPRGIQDASLGQVSFSIFGSFGAALQVVLIWSWWVSCTGEPLPRPGDTPGPAAALPVPQQMLLPPPQIIGNCVSLLVLSSALPVFSRTLGEPLGGCYIVFLYNMGFAGLTTLCLVKRFSWAVQAELIRAFGED